MKSNNSKKILIGIIVCIIIIAILLGGLAFAYFKTDIFKTDKELFFKYASQLTGEDGFFSNDITAYFTKMSNTPYENTGTLNSNVTVEDNQEEYEDLNNLNINFSGQLDWANKKVNENISIDYTEDVSFPFIVRVVDDMYGIQTDYIGSKFIAQRQNDTNSAREESDGLENVNFSKEQLDTFFNNYANSVNEIITDDKISRAEYNELKGYKLSLTTEDAKAMYVALLNTLKNDAEMLSTLSQFANKDLTTQDIDNLINEINSYEVQDQTINITVYEQNGQLTRIDANINESKISLEKNKTDNNLKYTLNLNPKINGEEITISFIAEYKGLNELQTVEENYSLEVAGNLFASNNNEISTDNSLSSTEQNDKNSNASYGTRKYNLSNKVNFVNTVDIENLTEDNALILSDYEEVQVDNLMNSIQLRLEEVNNDILEKLDVDVNPLMKFIPILTQVYSSATETVEEGTNELEGLEISAFNAKFEQYESTNSMGTTTRGLLTVIQANNAAEDSESKKIKEINFDGTEYEANEQNILLVKTSIEPGNSYKVEFEKDEQGMIYRVVINKK